MKKFSQSLSLLLSIAVLAASVYGIVNRQKILDYLALRNYAPGDRISAIADQTTMQENTRRIFYVNHPQLNSKEEFRKNCPTGDTNEHSIVLGCYIERDGIYLQDVTDERLSGVVQVTAAHEVLHAHYDRLNKDEKSKVDRLTQDYFNQVTNDRIKKTIEQYRKKDPSVVPNELHSILATEVRDLTPELENYYSRYFKDRKTIVSFSEKYEQTFLDLKEQVDQYDKELDSLRKQIESNQLELEGLGTEIESRKNLLDSQLSSGRSEQYNQSVPGYNALVNEYNALLNGTRGLIEKHNQLVQKRNDIVVTEQELVKSIDPNALPEKSQ